ncbi:MAG: Ig-like domain-containing protein, partial [Candidatus Peribacteria bacterium]|nr:Ig-like domain-containing protein [Candidatus Peribacteria bacterium]
MEKKKFFKSFVVIALAIFWGATSLVAQDTIPLDINSDGEAVITEEGHYWIPSTWIVPSGQSSNVFYKVKVVMAEGLDPSKVFLYVKGWTDVLRLYPEGYGTGNQGLKMPGSYSIHNNAQAGGKVMFHVVYIDDPIVKINGNTITGKKRLSQWNGTLTVNAGDIVVLDQNDFFSASGNGSSWLEVNGVEVATNLTSYPLSSYANNSQVVFNSRDGFGPNPTHSMSFKLVFQSSNVPVSGVSVIPPTKTMQIGEKFTPTATVLPANATNKAVTWSTSNPGVVSINATTGEVTGISAGSATITATTVDGGFTATCEITVQAATVHATGVTLNEGS